MNDCAILVHVYIALVVHYFGKIDFAADKLSGVPISTNLYSFGTNACIEPDSIRQK